LGECPTVRATLGLYHIPCHFAGPAIVQVEMLWYHVLLAEKGAVFVAAPVPKGDVPA
jgi:hypothetical protein